MKLDLMTVPQQVVAAVLAYGQTMPTTCRGGELCPAENLVKIVEDAIQLARLSNLGILNKQLQFLRGLCAVQTDGRDCPAPDILLNFKKLETGAWKKDRAMVLSGIILRAVELSDNDYLALSLTRDD